MSLLQKKDKLVLVVTHDPHTALMARRRIVLAGGAVAAVVERKKLLTHSEMKAARYARSVQCFVEYLRDTGRLDVVVDRGMRRFVRR